MSDNNVTNPVEEVQPKRGMSASTKNNLRTLGTVLIALAVVAAVVGLCELYQHLCLTVWAR